MKLTTNHTSSSYGQPVLVDAKGTPYGISDVLPDGQTGIQYVQSHPRVGTAEMRRRYINLHRAMTGQPTIGPPVKKTTKLRGRAAAIATYTGFNGPATMAAVEAQIPDELRKRLTGYEYGLVMSAVNNAYHNGRKSHGGIDLCDDCVWFPWGGDIKTECGVCNTSNPDKCICVDKIGRETGQLIPIAAIKKIKIDHSIARQTRYTLDYTEIS